MLKKESVKLGLNIDGLEQTQQRAGVNMKTALSNSITAEEFLDKLRDSPLLRKYNAP
jgi:hypothetical protein